MRLGWMFVGSLLLGACSEYNIAAPPSAFGEPNPAGLSNPTNTDKIVQVTTPSVDVLWVVDNSGSMSDNQRALADNFPLFMDYFLGSGLDYHIGVVSTDMDANAHKGKLREVNGVRWVDVNNTAPMETFAAMAQMGINGSSDERGREAAYSALEIEKNGYNAGFLRDDLGAGLHVVVISDEQDYSRANVVTKAEFIAYMNGLRPEDDLVTFNSIVNAPTGGGVFGSIDAGTDYLELTDGIGGLKKDIAAADWVDVLEQLGLQAAGLKREYFLSRLPVPETIEVWVEMEGTTLPFTQGVDYTYSSARNSITFDSYVPDPLAEVFVTYDVLASVVDGLE